MGFHQSQIWNKLYEICKLYSNAKRLGINCENQTDDTFIKMMNTPTVLRNCNLMYLPISLDASKFIETEKIFPYVDSLVKRSKPQYLMLLKENNIATHPLTLRELEVLRYLNEGNTNKEISERLFISLNTVKTHIKNIYSKLNVNKRIELKGKIKLITNLLLVD